MVIFHSYVKLPEGTRLGNGSIWCLNFLCQSSSSFLDNFDDSMIVRLGLRVLEILGQTEPQIFLAPRGTCGCIPQCLTQAEYRTLKPFFSWGEALSSCMQLLISFWSISFVISTLKPSISCGSVQCGSFPHCPSGPSKTLSHLSPLFSPAFCSFP